MCGLLSHDLVIQDISMTMCVGVYVHARCQCACVGVYVHACVCIDIYMRVCVYTALWLGGGGLLLNCSRARMTWYLMREHRSRWDMALFWIRPQVNGSSTWNNNGRQTIGQPRQDKWSTFLFSVPHVRARRKTKFEWPQYSYTVSSKSIGTAAHFLLFWLCIPALWIGSDTTTEVKVRTMGNNHWIMILFWEAS